MVPIKLMPMDVDFEIYKRVEAERRSFDEPPYVALRRLLGLAQTNDAEELAQLPGRPWRDCHLEIPHGTEARMTYGRGKQNFTGKFLEGKLVVDGRSYGTLSEAASALATTKDGHRTSLNGWNYWEVRLPGETQWRSMAKMRQEAQKRVAH